MNPRPGGFSYLELLVVVAISALLITAVRFTSSSESLLRQQSLKILALQNELADVAIFDGTPVAMIMDGNGYRFERRYDGQWLPMEQKPFVIGTLPEPLWLASANGCSAGALEQPVRILMLPNGVRTPFRLRVCDGETGVTLQGLHSHGVMHVGE